MDKKQFVTSCVGALAEDIDAMTYHDGNQEITYGTFVKHVGVEQLKELFPDLYDCEPSLGNDPCVSFHKSQYRGEACVYMKHSAIEYIFC